MDDICTYCNEPFNHDADREYTFGAIVCDDCFKSLQFTECKICGLFVQGLSITNGVCEDCESCDDCELYDNDSDSDDDDNWSWIDRK